MDPAAAERRMVTARDEVAEAVVETSLGSVRIEATSRGVRRMSIEASNGSGSTVPSDPRLADALAWLEAFTADPFTIVTPPPLDLSDCADFHRRVLTALHERVPAGSVVSYGALAELVGAPRAARAVGSAMAANPVALVVPCHRVVRGDGSIGAYSGADGPRTKAALLRREGRHIQRVGRVDRVMDSL